MRKRTLVQLVLLTAVMMLSSCTASFPDKESIAALTNEQAANALTGRTEKEINENWGEPDGMLSGFYGDIYEYNSRQIIIYCDGDHKVTDVRIIDREN